ncbi:hypothetical protein HZS_1111, partial [Henneguya salminicola]
MSHEKWKSLTMKKSSNNENLPNKIRKNISSPEFYRRQCLKDNNLSYLKLTSASIKSSCEPDRFIANFSSQIRRVINLLRNQNTVIYESMLCCSILNDFISQIQEAKHSTFQHDNIIFDIFKVLFEDENNNFKTLTNRNKLTLEFSGILLDLLNSLLLVDKRITAMAVHFLNFDIICKWPNSFISYNSTDIEARFNSFIQLFISILKNGGSIVLSHVCKQKDYITSVFNNFNYYSNGNKLSLLTLIETNILDVKNISFEIKCSFFSPLIVITLYRMIESHNDVFDSLLHSIFNKLLSPTPIGLINPTIAYPLSKNFSNTHIVTILAKFLTHNIKPSNTILSALSLYPNVFFELVDHISNCMNTKMKNVEKYIKIIDYLIKTVPEPCKYLDNIINDLQPTDIGQIINLCVPFKWGSNYLTPALTEGVEQQIILALKSTELILTCALSICKYLSAKPKRLIISFLGGTLKRIISLSNILSLIKNEHEVVKNLSMELLFIFVNIFKYEHYGLKSKMLRQNEICLTCEFILERKNLKITDINYVKFCNFFELFLNENQNADYFINKHQQDKNTAFLNFFFHKYIYSTDIQTESTSFNIIVKILSLNLHVESDFCLWLSMMRLYTLNSHFSLILSHMISILYSRNTFTQRWYFINSNQYDEHAYTLNSFTLISLICHLLQDGSFIDLITPHIENFVSYTSLTISVYIFTLNTYSQNFLTLLSSFVSILTQISRTHFENNEFLSESNKLFIILLKKLHTKQNKILELDDSNKLVTTSTTKGKKSISLLLQKCKTSIKKFWCIFDKHFFKIINQQNLKLSNEYLNRIMCKISNQHDVSDHLELFFFSFKYYIKSSFKIDEIDRYLNMITDDIDAISLQTHIWYYISKYQQKHLFEFTLKHNLMWKNITGHLIDKNMHPKRVYKLLGNLYKISPLLVKVIVPYPCSIAESVISYLLNPSTLNDKNACAEFIYYYLTFGNDELTILYHYLSNYSANKNYISVIKILISEYSIFLTSLIMSLQPIKKNSFLKNIIKQLVKFSTENNKYCLYIEKVISSSSYDILLYISEELQKYNSPYLLPLCFKTNRKIFSEKGDISKICQEFIQSILLLNLDEFDCYFFDHYHFFLKSLVEDNIEFIVKPKDMIKFYKFANKNLNISLKLFPICLILFNKIPPQLINKIISYIFGSSLFSIIMSKEQDLIDHHFCHWIKLIFTIINEYLKSEKSLSDYINERNINFLICFISSKYKATLSEQDRIILNVNYLISKFYTKYNLFKMESSAPLFDYSLNDHTIPSYIDTNCIPSLHASEILSKLNSTTLLKSCHCFPLNRKLNVLQDINFNCNGIDTSIYDPSFLLCLFNVLLNYKQINEIIILEIIESHIFGFIIMSLSSCDSHTRQLGYHLIQKFQLLLKSVHFHAQQQIEQLINFLKNSLTEINQQLLKANAIILSHLSIILLDPNNILYSYISSMFIHSAFFNNSSILYTDHFIYGISRTISNLDVTEMLNLYISALSYSLDSRSDVLVMIKYDIFTLVSEMYCSKISKKLSN